MCSSDLSPTDDETDLTVSLPDLSALQARLPLAADISENDIPIALHVVNGSQAALSAAGEHEAA